LLYSIIIYFFTFLHRCEILFLFYLGFNFFLLFLFYFLLNFFFYFFLLFALSLNNFILLFLFCFFLTSFNLFRSQFYLLFFNFFNFLSLFMDLLFYLLASILQVKSLRKLEIQLACSALMFSAKSIEEFKINFWSIKSTISWINFVTFSEFL
jgi:hypothetical protein